MARKIRFDDELKHSVYGPIYDKIETASDQYQEDHDWNKQTDVVRAVARIICGTSKSYNDNDKLEIHIATLKHMVSDMCGLTVDEFSTLYSTSFCKKIMTENIGRKITSYASEKIKAECLFDQKRMLFKMVYPEYYERTFPPITAKDIYLASSDLKSNLVRAGRIFDENGEKVGCGEIVDKIIHNAITEVMASSDVTDTVEIMRLLADTKRLKASEEGIPGCFSIIEERGCYACPLDFYFLNLKPSDQAYVIDDYMKIRNEFKSIKKEPLIDKLYEFYKDNKDEMIDAILYNEL